MVARGFLTSLALAVGLLGGAEAADEVAPKQAEEPAAGEGDCHPSYGGCLDPDASDYDCAGGAGNGPLYTGPVKVLGPDVFKLDTDGDGWGCE